MFGGWERSDIFSVSLSSSSSMKLGFKGGREACVIREAFYMEKTEAHVASLLVTSLYDLWVTEGRDELGAMACTN